MNARPLCGLPRAAAITLHGQAMYVCWATLYQPAAPLWSELTVQEQHHWVQRAADVMDSLRPQPAPSLFQRIADVARGEAKRVLEFRGPK